MIPNTELDHKWLTFVGYCDIFAGPDVSGTNPLGGGLMAATTDNVGANLVPEMVARVLTGDPVVSFAEAATALRDAPEHLAQLEALVAQAMNMVIDGSDDQELSICSWRHLPSPVRQSFLPSVNPLMRFILRARGQNQVACTVTWCEGMLVNTQWMFSGEEVINQVYTAVNAKVQLPYHEFCHWMRTELHLLRSRIQR